MWKRTIEDGNKIRSIKKETIDEILMSYDDHKEEWKLYVFCNINKYVIFSSKTKSKVTKKMEELENELDKT